jgi:hypothetical protein
MNNDAFEKAWSELTAPQNETVTSKWYFKKGYEAATKAALVSRVVLPELFDFLEKGIELDKTQRAEDPLAHYIQTATLHYQWYRDNIKLIPLTAEELMSDEAVQLAATKDSASFRNDNKEKYCTNKDFVEARMNAFIRGANYVRESIKKRLGGE